MAIRIRQGLVSAAFGAMVLAFAAAPLTTASAQFTPQSEAAAHPRLVEAIHNCEAAYRLLEAAPDDFGGHKAQAMADLRAAIHSLKRALYFRLNMDDAAVDRLP